MSRINRDALCLEYEQLRCSAPKRWNKGKKYFMSDHKGFLSEKGSSNRIKEDHSLKEEHLAIALWRMACFWPRPETGWLRLLDYQVPLAASGCDKGIGEVDLLGVTDCGRLTVIELKIKPVSGRGDSPPAALMQSLRYASIVDANRKDIASEARSCFDAEVCEKVPIVQILAPRAWWLGWQVTGTTRNKAGIWEPEFAKLAQDVEERLGVVVELVAIEDIKPADISYGPAGKKPRIDFVPELYPVHCSEIAVIGSALPRHRFPGML